MSKKKESNQSTDWEIPTIWEIIDRMSFKWLLGWDDDERARNSDGTYKGDDLSTPEVNEAWESGKSPKKKVTRKTRKKVKKNG
tara:strand:- start:100 stop:348 length:249 start_codon:yes stop_codon:yes gene_type:complete